MGRAAAIAAVVVVVDRTDHDDLVLLVCAWWVLTMGRMAWGLMQWAMAHTLMRAGR